MSNTNPSSPPQFTALAERVRAIVAESGGHWATCTGCYEGSDGQNVNGYPFSQLFGCIVGNGCHECGGLGATWDNTDYEEWASWMLQQELRTKDQS